MKIHKNLDLQIEDKKKIINFPRAITERLLQAINRDI